MNVWLWSALALQFALIPCLIVSFRGDVADRLVGLEFSSVVVTIELLLLAQGFNHPSFYDLSLTLVLLSFGGGMVFARFVQRWL
ncbi:MAG TPA: monovalent cation/H+ antiporter complex subunit F [Tepidisphaeraceae bacterium]|nr:monovalent cation/H+ antiporter complex subunit F [Tepidisphaeraceae bacterium]